MREKFIQKLRQILALSAIVIIVLLYILTLILSLINSSYTQRLFRASLFATFFVPIMIYLFVWITRLFSNPPKEQTSNQKESEHPNASSDTTTGLHK